MKGCGIAAGADGSSDNLLGERPKGHQIAATGATGLAPYACCLSLVHEGPLSDGFKEQI